MPRPYEIPDPNDVTPNNPGKIIAQDQVLGLYNQAHPNDNMQKVTDKVKDWTLEEVKSAGWDEATFVGSQCVVSRTDLQVR